MLQVDLINIFKGTYHIFLFYGILLFSIIYLFSVSKFFSNIIDRLDEIQVSKEDPSFKMTYFAILILIVLIAGSIIIIGQKDLRAGNFQMFVIFAILSFWIVPFALGLLALYSFIISREEYHLGREFILGISFMCFGAVGSNIHDVLWCGVHTEGYQNKKIAGSDIALFYLVFGLNDPGIVDYRSFGLFMLVQVIIELIIGSIAFYKFYSLNRNTNPDIKNSVYLKVLVMLINASVILGIIEYIFDAPWHFTDLQYNFDVYLGIPLITAFFCYIGYFFGKKNKV